MEIAQTGDNTYEVLSDSGNIYKLKVNAVGVSCTCLGYKHRHACKHIKLLDIQEKKRYPRHVADYIIMRLEPALGNIKYTIAGSYRREKETIGDVDILLVTDSLKGITEKILEIPQTKIIMSGEQIIRGTVQTSSGEVQFDITRVNEDELASYLLYRTGPKELNIKMRMTAKLLGYKLNEHGLWLDDEQIQTKTEADIFEALDMKYIKPEMR